jgi:hypothetical protein
VTTEVIAARALGCLLQRQNSMTSIHWSGSPLCWAHARRQFFELADIVRRGKQAPAISPIALEAVKRIDAVRDRALHQRPSRERNACACAKSKARRFWRFENLA